MAKPTLAKPTLAKPGAMQETSPPMSRPSIAELALSRVRSAPPDHPFVVAQLGQSLDGRIATISGDSRGISGPAALDHLHALRAAVDAVVVGVGTVIADDPRLTVRRVDGRHPVRVVIDPDHRAPSDARCFDDDGTARFRVSTGRCHVSGDEDRSGRVSPAEDPRGVSAIVLPREGHSIDPARIIADLFQRGLRRILVEGGADTLSRFLSAGVVDRLHILMAPVILGSGKAGVELAPIGSIAEALRPATRAHLFADGDVLFDCDLRA
jgi:diaminohydroxyphosphoribosylaminopyrimidine deaminase / 5-amino-6-(5-phosphoribosylamino)uracil reductase